MGKGDQKTRRGKIQVGSFGVVRPRKKAKSTTAASPVKEAKVKAPAKKASAKKTAAK